MEIAIHFDVYGKVSIPSNRGGFLYAACSGERAVA
jgi:hypothetical protein